MVRLHHIPSRSLFCCPVACGEPLQVAARSYGMSIVIALVAMMAAARSCSAFVQSWRPVVSSIPKHNRRFMMSVSSTSLRPRKLMRPLVVCGPSGVGKGTIISKFMEDSAQSNLLPKFGFSVSHTTRQPRPGEVDGIHYNFVTRKFFDEKIAQGDFFIEWAEVHGNMYGTSFQAIFDVTQVNESESDIPDGVERQCLLDIDVEGVKSIKKFQSQQQSKLRKQPTLGKAKSTQQYLAKESQELPLLCPNFIFIAPPSIDTLRERLLNRGTETPETLERRFANANAELDYGMVAGNFDAIIVNDDLGRACSDFTTAVMGMYSLNNE